MVLPARRVSRESHRLKCIRSVWRSLSLGRPNNICLNYLVTRKSPSRHYCHWRHPAWTAYKGNTAGIVCILPVLAAWPCLQDGESWPRIKTHARRYSEEWTNNTNKRESQRKLVGRRKAFPQVQRRVQNETEDRSWHLRRRLSRRKNSHQRTFRSQENVNKLVDRKQLFTERRKKKGLSDFKTRAHLH